MATYGVTTIFMLVISKSRITGIDIRLCTNLTVFMASKSRLKFINAHKQRYLKELCVDETPLRTIPMREFFNVERLDIADSCIRHLYIQNCTYMKNVVLSIW